MLNLFNKTFARLRLNYYWDKIIDDIQDNIDQCLHCILKKLTRIKTKQRMILTDNQGSAFDKLAVDITFTI